MTRLLGGLVLAVVCAACGGGDDDAPAIDAAPTSDGAPVVNGTPILVALGEVGRSTVSCDGGRTWVADTTLQDDPALSRLFCDVEQPDLRCGAGTCQYPNDSGVCSENSCGCAQLPFASRGGMVHAGWVFKKVGEVQGNVLQRSRDGVTWETVVDADDNYVIGPAVAGDDLLLVGFNPSADLNVWSSTDDGATWSEPAVFDLTELWAPTKAVTIQHEGQDVALFFGRINSPLALRATSAGAIAPIADIPSECLNPNNILIGNGRVLLVNGVDTLCISDDGGQSFTVATGVEPFASGALQLFLSTHIADQGVAYDGTSMYLFGRSFAQQGPTVLRTTDGTAWDDLGLQPEIDLPVITYDPRARRFVAWAGAYETQQVYLSDDAITWEAVDPAGFTRGHPITSVEVSVAPEGFACPSS